MAADWKPPSVTVAAVIEREGRFLVVEENYGGARVLNQSAGHLDPGESLAPIARTCAISTLGAVEVVVTVPS